MAQPTSPRSEPDVNVAEAVVKGARLLAEINENLASVTTASVVCTGNENIEFRTADDRFAAVMSAAPPGVPRHMIPFFSLKYPPSHI